MKLVFAMAFLAISVIGQGGDPWQTMWRFEHKGVEGIQGFIADISGKSEDGLVNLSVWPWMPFHYVFGEPLAYNVIWLLQMIFTGFSMALFVKMITKQQTIFSSAPVLAGIAYMLLPYRMAHAFGHFGAMQLQWIPFICTAVVLYVRSPRIWKAVLIGLLFSIQAWTEHHYALWLVIFAVIAALIYRKELQSSIRNSHPLQLPLGQGERTRAPLLTKERLGEVSLLVVILIFGVIVPYIPTIKLAVNNSSALELGLEQTTRFSADLFSFITPSHQHPIWGDFFNNLFGKYFTGNSAESVQYLGISIIIAILFFHRHIPVRQKRLWIWTIIIFGLISLGPVLHVFGKETGIPLPYALLANFPIFSAIRVVARAGVMVGFATCALFGWVIATNKHRNRTSILVGIVILVEFLFLPFPIQSAQLSPAYTAITNIKGSRIIEVPAATNYTAASRSLYASALHGKEPIGNIALERGSTEDIYNLAKSLPGVRQLLYLRTTELKENRSEFFNQNLAETLPDAMKYINAYAILVHTDSLSNVQVKALGDFLAGIPGLTRESFGDADLYTLNEVNTSSDGVLLVRGDGWENVGYDQKRNSTFAEISNQTDVQLINLNKYTVTIELQYSLAQESTGELHADTTFELAPGEQRIIFKHSGIGKSIIQNSKLRVIPLTP